MYSSDKMNKVTGRMCRDVVKYMLSEKYIQLGTVHSHTHIQYIYIHTSKKRVYKVYKVSNKQSKSNKCS